MIYKDISIKRILSTGLYKHSINFSDSNILNNFLGRSRNYTSAVIRKKQYIITDTLKNYYVITSYNGNKADVDKKIQDFYDTHIWKNGTIYAMKPLVIPTKEQIQENKIRHIKVGKLLSLIQVKYGGVDNAEGTKEFSELQKLLNTERD